MVKMDFSKDPRDEIPTGIYRLTASKCEIKTGQESGNRRFEVTFKIEGKNPTVTEHVMIDGKHGARVMAGEKMRALGINPDGDVSPNDFVGRECYARLKMEAREWKGRTFENPKIFAEEGDNSQGGLWPIKSPPVEWREPLPFDAPAEDGSGIPF